LIFHDFSDFPSLINLKSYGINNMDKIRHVDIKRGSQTATGKGHPMGKNQPGKYERA
jgi:hypothetical protein